MFWGGLGYEDLKMKRLITPVLGFFPSDSSKVTVRIMLPEALRIFLYCSLFQLSSVFRVYICMVLLGPVPPLEI